MIGFVLSLKDKKWKVDDHNPTLLANFLSVAKHTEIIGILWPLVAHEAHWSHVPGCSLDFPASHSIQFNSSLMGNYNFVVTVMILVP